MFSDLLTEFQFAEKDLESLDWENDDEFEYQGMMYDVVKRIDTNSTTILLCWNDHDEDKINSLINQLIAEAQTQGPGNDKSISKDGSVKDYYPITHQITVPTDVTVKSIKTTHPCGEICEFHQSFLHPPQVTIG